MACPNFLEEFRALALPAKQKAPGFPGAFRFDQRGAQIFPALSICIMKVSKLYSDSCSHR